MAKTHSLIVNGDPVTLSHRQYMRAVSDATKVRCTCRACVLCAALANQRAVLRSAHARGATS